MAWGVVVGFNGVGGWCAGCRVQLLDGCGVGTSMERLEGRGRKNRQGQNKGQGRSLIVWLSWVMRQVPPEYPIPVPTSGSHQPCMRYIDIRRWRQPVSSAQLPGRCRGTLRPLRILYKYLPDPRNFSQHGPGKPYALARLRHLIGYMYPQTHMTYHLLAYTRGSCTQKDNAQMSGSQRDWRRGSFRRYPRPPLHPRYVFAERASGR